MFVVALSYVDLLVPLGSVKALRLLRMLRIVRLLHSFPALRSVVQSLVVAFKNVVYLLFLVRATTLSLSTHQCDTTTDTFS